MNETQHPADSYANSPCSRGEAMELAIRTAVIAHLGICLVALFGLACSMGAGGIWLGLGVAAILAAAIPFLVLPMAAATGFLLHLAFHRTQLPIPTLVRVIVILFEASLMGWLVFIVLLLRQP